MSIFQNIGKAVFGSSNDRYVASIQKIVATINAYEDQIVALTDEELQGQTEKFRRQLEEGKTLDDIMPEAFATVREASKRVLGMRHFDVQMVGGVVLHRGEIAEMRTGEGKTLVATLACYLNALEGKGVHVVTVNDSLARRDAEWMGQLYRWLGLTVGVIVPNLGEFERREAYGSDITYGTNNEFGFDYLRDNMKHERSQMVQRPFNHAIIDEVDSILIDEARTPLIISGPTEDKTDLYVTIDQVVKKFVADHDALPDGAEEGMGFYDTDEKSRTVSLTEDGAEEIERRLAESGLLETDNLYDVENTQVVHHLNEGLRANLMFKLDDHYIVKDNKVVIIDEFTGRMMDGRRWSNGLHQAVEAKEGVKIEPENQTMASITFQNYFRMYPKLSGMTGTAATEAAEFWDIYKMNVVEIPTNVPVQRIDEDDEFYKNTLDKFQAIAKAIREKSEIGQPVLVGTVSIEKSELLSQFLDKEGVKHEVLNARQHEREAHIVAQAGRPGAVTIATNMAGRGTDIQLGGNLDFLIEDEVGEMPEGPERDRAIEKIKAQVAEDKAKVLEAGGLFVLGTERHESRRIDNQLRGRSGRQGDPGRSSFYLSLEDDLMRIFGSERLEKVLTTLGLKEGEAIVHPWVNKSLERAQAKVEGRNFDIRKQLLKFDDVMNDQRKVIFGQRRDIMEAADLQEITADMREQVIDDLIDQFMPPKTYADQWDTQGFQAAVADQLNLDVPVAAWCEEEGVDDEVIRERLVEASENMMAQKAEQFGPENMRNIEKQVLLQAIDGKWRDHLLTLEHLRSVVGFRGYAQRDPLNEYKNESFQLFESMLDSLRTEVTQKLGQIRPMTEEEQQQILSQMQERQAAAQVNAAQAAEENSEAPASTAAAASGSTAVAGFDENDPSTWGTPARNDECPCGSGKKFKHCHGSLTGVDQRQV